MSQISRFPLPLTLEKEIHTALHQALADLHNQSEIQLFLTDLLTPTERIMLAKRLAIALLLDQGYDQRSIHTILKVSVSTVSAVNYWLKNQGKGYHLVITKLKTQKNWQQLKEELGEAVKDIFSVKRQLHGRPIKETKPIDSIL
jgi:uncharacterized protein YerC